MAKVFPDISSESYFKEASQQKPQTQININ